MDIGLQSKTLQIIESANFLSKQMLNLYFKDIEEKQFQLRINFRFYSNLEIQQKRSLCWDYNTVIKKFSDFMFPENDFLSSFHEILVIA